MEDSVDKVERVLDIYTRLMSGAVINKYEEALKFAVNERSIQRDIDKIRNYLAEVIVNDGVERQVIYDRTKKGYYLKEIYQSKFENSEILAICKIILDSRAFTKSEVDMMLNKLIMQCVPESNQKVIKELIGNEQFHYIELQHKSVFVDKLWDLGLAIKEHNYIEIKYQGTRGSSIKTRRLRPLAIMFSEYYFYLAAFIDDIEVRENFSVLDDYYPTIYRIDRIQELKRLDENFRIPYSDRFEEGEFRKRIQFMYGGKLRKINFEYSGYSVESILDRLPTAKVEKQKLSEDGKKNIYTISAEVFGDGIDMWIRSQGNNSKVYLGGSVLCLTVI